MGMDSGWWGMIGIKANMIKLATIEKCTGIGGHGCNAHHTHQKILIRTPRGSFLQSLFVGGFGTIIIIFR